MATGNPIIYIMSGMSFAGKSVLAMEIGSAKGIEVLDPDSVALQRALAPEGTDDWFDQWKEIITEAEAKLAEAVRSGTSMVYDSTNQSREARDKMRAQVRENGGLPIVIIVEIDREEALRRWEKNAITGERFAVGRFDFDLCADTFELPARDEERALIFHSGCDHIGEWIKQNLSERSLSAFRDGGRTLL